MKKALLLLVLFSTNVLSCIVDPFEGVSKELDRVNAVSMFDPVERMYALFLSRSDVLTAQAYYRWCSISPKYLVIVCDSLLSINCTNGMYPPGPEEEAIEDISQDHFVREYWENNSAYYSQIGQVGPSNIDAPIEVEIYCGAHYCRLFFSHDLPEGPSYYDRHQALANLFGLLQQIPWFILLLLTPSVHKRLRKVNNQKIRKSGMIITGMYVSLVVYILLYVTLAKSIIPAGCEYEDPFSGVITFMTVIVWGVLTVSFLKKYRKPGKK